MITLFASFFTSMAITMFAIPSIIRVAKIKHLYDEPDARKHHKSAIPTLGGLAIFAGLIFSLTFWSNQSQIVELQYIISAITILFFMGMKDDIIALRAYKKLIGQLIAAVILVHFAGIRINTFYGLFGISDIPIYVSYLLTVFVITGITNSLNLIDGLDGLAGTIGVIASVCFGTWFYFVESYQFAILSYALCGSLIGFLWFNWSPAKIFMGDTGSLILGLILSILAIKFIEMNRVMEREAPYKVLSVPVITMAILIIPLFDTVRVFMIRILEGRSPFKPDRNHIHHILTDLGLNHAQSTLMIASFNISMIGLFWFLKGHISGEVMLLLINIICFLTILQLKTLTKKRKHSFLK